MQVSLSSPPVEPLTAILNLPLMARLNHTDCMTPMLSKVLGQQDVNGWLMSEKLDGVRAVWDGVDLRTRTGKTINAPQWWLDRLPTDVCLDGELFAGRGGFQQVLSSYSRKTPVDAEWQDLQFVAFDIPVFNVPAADRINRLRSINVQQVKHIICNGRNHALEHMDRIVGIGGEGVMLRQPDAEYIPSRTSALLKCKPDEGC